MEDDPIATHRTIRRTLIGSIGLLLLTGCAHCYDPIDDALTCLHCEVEAMQTWRYLRGDYSGVNYPHHFGAGFRAGYINVCRGGAGCPPTLPPKCYWGVWYRNAPGRAKTVEWFNGFSAGAAVAMNSGHRQYGQLVTAYDIDGACGCGEEVEYDLSDLGQHPGDDSLPDGCPDHYDALPTPTGREGWPASPPAMMGPPDEDARGHQEVQPPRQEGPFSGLFDKPLFVPERPLPEPDAKSAPDASGTPFPFGHSMRNESAAPDADSEPADPSRPPTLSGDARSEDVSVDPEPAEPPASELQSKEAELEPHVQPSSPAPPANEPAPEKSPPPAPERSAPPLEDRFLPRSGREPVRRSMPDNSARYKRSSQALFEAFGQIERTSHSLPAGTPIR